MQDLSELENMVANLDILSESEILDWDQQTDVSTAADLVRKVWYEKQEEQEKDCD